MEDEAMKMLIKSDVDNSHLLLEQYNNAIISERRFTGCGFFTEYVVPTNIGKLQRKQVEPIDTVVARVGDLNALVGFLLFFVDGLISTLECHELDITGFPEEITSYSLSYAFYDEMGLLKPSEIDKFTNYRLYSTEQIPILNKGQHIPLSPRHKWVPVVGAIHYSTHVLQSP